MEVFKFNLEFERPSWYFGSSTMKNTLIDGIQKRSKNTEHFALKWKAETEDKVMDALANKDDLLYANIKSNYTYFIFEQEDRAYNNIKNLIIDVIVITESSIGNTLKGVVKDLNGISFYSKIKNLKDNNLKIYPINIKKHDIQDTAIHIKTKITKNVLEKSEIISVTLGTGIIIISGLILWALPVVTDELIKFVEYVHKFVIAGIFLSIVPLFKLLLEFFISTDYNINIISAENVLPESTTEDVPQQEALVVPVVPRGVGS